MTKNKCVAFATLLGALVLSPAVRAQSWSTIGTSCSPGVDSIGLYNYSNATFEFASGETGTIRTRCQVNNPLDTGVPKWSTLTAGFVDPDGTHGEYEVQAQLVRVNRSTGTTGIIKTLDSDSYPATGPVSRSVSFTHTFDFTNYAYYVTLTVSRDSTSLSPWVWYASLK